MNDQITELPIDKVHPAEWQAREDFDDESLNELGQSLKEKGIIQPIVVRKHEDGYQIIAGERRYRAWKTLDKKTIPVIIKDVDDFEAKEISITENWQRQDLTDHEKEKFIYHLWLEGSMNGKYTSQGDMARKTGISQRMISKIVLAIEEKNSISNKKAFSIFRESTTEDLEVTRALKKDVETRAEVLQIRVDKKINQKDLRQVSKAVVDAPQEARKEIVNLISTEQLKPSEVESFVKSINVAPKRLHSDIINLVEEKHLESKEVEIFVKLINDVPKELRKDVIDLVKEKYLESKEVESFVKSINVAPGGLSRDVIHMIRGKHLELKQVEKFVYDRIELIKKSHEEKIDCIEPEKLDVKEVAKFADALKQSPSDVRQKLLKKEITPEEAMQVNTFKTSEQREIVMEENKVIREVAQQDQQRNINMRTQQVKDMEEGKPGEIIDSRIKKMGSDERYAEHIKKILGDIGINIKLKRIQDMENKEYRNECIFLLKNINEYTTNLLIELGEITELN